MRPPVPREAYFVKPASPTMRGPRLRREASERMIEGWGTSLLARYEIRFTNDERRA